LARQPETLTRLAKYSAESFRTLEAETGFGYRPASMWVDHSGPLTGERAKRVCAVKAAMARVPSGVEVNELSP